MASLVRVAPLLGSESVEVLGPFDSFVPHHPTDGPFEASHACLPCVAGRNMEQRGVGDGVV